MEDISLRSSASGVVESARYVGISTLPRNESPDIELVSQRESKRLQETRKEYRQDALSMNLCASVAQTFWTAIIALVSSCSLASAQTTPPNVAEESTYSAQALQALKVNNSDAAVKA